MIWSRTLKDCGDWQDVWDNDYFWEVNTTGEISDFGLLEQMALWDMSFHSNKVRHILTVMGETNGANGASPHSSCVWVPDRYSITGRRNVTNLRPFRWALLNTYFYPMGRVTHKAYRFALGDENVYISPEGRVSYKGDIYLEQSRGYEMQSNCRDLLGKERVGVGSPTTGGSFFYKAPIYQQVKTVSLLNASRRSYANRISIVTNGFKYILNAVAASMQQYHLAHDIQFVFSGDFVPAIMKTYCMSVVSGMLALCQYWETVSQGQLKNKRTIEESYHVQFGPTVSGLTSTLSNLNAQAQADREAIADLPIYLYLDNRYYMTESTKNKMWEIVKDYRKKFAPVCFFDSTSVYCDGAQKEDRVGGYVKGFPDL